MLFHPQLGEFEGKRSISQGEQPFPLISQLVESGGRGKEMKKESQMSQLPPRTSAEGGINVHQSAR